MILSSVVWQPYRIFNTWLGDPTKIMLLEEALKVIKRDNLLEVVNDSAAALEEGLLEIQASLQSQKHSVKWKKF